MVREEVGGTPFPAHAAASRLKLCHNLADTENIATLFPGLGMRISNSLLQQRLLRDLQANVSAVAQAQSQVSSGKRFETMGEDPSAGAHVLSADRGLRAIDQYRRNSTAARSRVDAEESVLNQLTDLLSRAKELATQEGSATGTPVTRQSTANEIQQIIGQVVQLGNTQVGSEFIFAGHQTGQPFDASGNYFGDTGIRQAEIGQGYLMTTNHTGQELLVSSGVLSSLQGLLAQLQTGTPATIQGTIGAIDSAFTQVQTMLATTGARSRQIDTAMQNADAIETSLTLAKSDAQDISLEEATTRLVGAQTTMQAALLSASRILNTSLTDYLK
jgi:flagellar hook-associated protein 3 FlgL